MTQVIYATSSDSSDYGAQLLSETGLEGSLWQQPSSVGGWQEAAATEWEAVGIGGGLGIAAATPLARPLVGGGQPSSEL